MSEAITTSMIPESGKGRFVVLNKTQAFRLLAHYGHEPDVIAIPAGELHASQRIAGGAIVGASLIGLRRQFYLSAHAVDCSNQGRDWKKVIAIAMTIAFVE
jgi:hypothetical protein